MSTWPTWDEWLLTLDPERRAAALALRDRFAALGDAEPEAAARSEVMEDVPQLARYLVLRRLWANGMSWTPEKVSQVPAARRLVEGGADPADVTRAMNAAAYDAVFAALYAISYGADPEEEDAALPGWCLLETTPEGELTGRPLGALHEDILTLDPSGRDGADLWA
ncbi:MAG: hypothetical protein GEV11_28035 [Streptosporangiales bacterium]|nr:hypothetical protein [Streptosporangiales bacterium]